LDKRNSPESSAPLARSLPGKMVDSLLRGRLSSGGGFGWGREMGREGSPSCPVAFIDDLYEITAEVDKVVTLWSRLSGVILTADPTPSFG